jgi:23S rRNA (guanosine2251-2'-O)-methyltransferase
MAKRGPGILIFGVNAVEGAISAGKARTVFVRAGALSPRIARLMESARQNGVYISTLNDKEFRSRFKESLQGIGAEVEPPDILDISVLLDEPADGVILALDHWEDPQNFGAVLRSAAAFGASAVLYPSRRATPVTPAVFSASAGYIYRVRLIEVPNLRYALESLQKRGWWTVGLTADATEDICEENMAPPVVIVVGSEGSGLSPLLNSSVDRRVRIPMASGVDSVNASVAAAIALYLAMQAGARSRKSVK